MRTLGELWVVSCVWKQMCASFEPLTSRLHHRYEQSMTDSPVLLSYDTLVPPPNQVHLNARVRLSRFQQVESSTSTLAAVSVQSKQIILRCKARKVAQQTQSVQIKTVSTKKCCASRHATRSTKVRTNYQPRSRLLQSNQGCINSKLNIW